MKTKIVSLLAILALGMAFCFNASAAKTKPLKGADKFHYDIEYIKSAGDGISTVDVFAYGKNKQEAWDRCEMCAVHGVIFKGYSGNGSYQSPLARSASSYDDNIDFFNNFFDNGEYRRYISNVLDGSQRIIKIKGGVKVECVVNVNVKMLRKHLEEAGIIKGLSSGF